MLDNRSRIYALESWTVEKKRRGSRPLSQQNERVPDDRAPPASRIYPTRRPEHLTKGT